MFERIRKIGFCLLLLLLIPAFNAEALKLTLVHTSDVHGHYESYDEAGSLGGSARLAAFFKQVKATYPTVVVVDTGDQSDKSPYVDMFGAELVSLNMRETGYDLWTLGNHEFSYGLAGLKQMTSRYMPPLLCANIKFKNNNVLAQSILPWTFKYSAGRKIGFIGVTTTTYYRENADWILTDPKAAVREAVAELEAEGANIIVLLSHCGYDLDVEMAREIAGLDVILGGHHHLLFSNTAADADEAIYPVIIDNGRQKVLLSNVGEFGRYAGLLNVIFDDQGFPVAWDGDSVLMDDAVAVGDVAEFLRPYKVRLDEELNQVIGNTLTPLNGERAAVLRGESATANLMGDALLAAGKPLGAQIAMLHAYSVGATACPAGEITLGQANGLLSATYRMFLVQVRGDVMLQTLEDSLNYLNGEAGDSENTLIFAGLRYTTDMARPAGQRVLNVEVAADDVYRPLDPESTYDVVTYGYLLGRVDGYQAFQQNLLNCTPLERNSEEILMKYIKQNSPLNPLAGGRAVIENFVN